MVTYFRNLQLKNVCCHLSSGSPHIPMDWVALNDSFCLRGCSVLPAACEGRKVLLRYGQLPSSQRALSSWVPWWVAVPSLHKSYSVGQANLLVRWWMLDLPCWGQWLSLWLLPESHSSRGFQQRSVSISIRGRVWHVGDLHRIWSRWFFWLLQPSFCDGSDHRCSFTLL